MIFHTCTRTRSSTNSTTYSALPVLRGAGKKRFIGYISNLMTKNGASKFCKSASTIVRKKYGTGTSYELL
jgi:hypothetical protein